MNYTVKRADLGNLEVVIKMARSTNDYSGTAGFKGVDPDGNEVQVWITVEAESAPSDPA